MKVSNYNALSVNRVYCVYISQLIPFARVSSRVDDFNTRNMVLTAKLLYMDIDIIKFVKRFQNFIGGILT